MRGIDKAINELNSLSIELTPSLVQDFGFIAGTKSYIETMSQGLPVEFICKDEKIEELSLSIKVLLFRMIQSFLLILSEQKNQNFVSILVEYKKPAIKLEMNLADADFVFKKESKQYMDLIKRVQYFGAELEEFVVNKTKLFRIRIDL